jgi:hypothetical protein
MDTTGPGRLESGRADPEKAALALQLRQETILTLKWTARRLNIGTWEYVRRLPYEARQENPKNETIFFHWLGCGRCFDCLRLVCLSCRVFK